MSQLELKPNLLPVPETARFTLRGHLQIARIDHWCKNVFVFPGIVAAIGINRGGVPPGLLLRSGLGLASICLIASSNYVLNEVLDAPYDRMHPLKWARPVPSGQVSLPVAYGQWIALMLIGVALGLCISPFFMGTALALWIMGCIYNIPPVRSKDLPYVDVLSEAVNNPLRLLAGWLLVGTRSIAPASLLLSYWMIGCYFMAMKRYAEYRSLGDAGRAASYRKSFATYTEERLLVSIMFYGSSAMLFLGAFIMRYRMELILAFPLVALVMAIYLSLAFKPNSPVENPEKLYREPRLMAALALCTLVIGVLLLVDLPALHTIVSPTAPTIAAHAGR
ncbi:MAG TPA: UbiA prenyltransferase family protein [Chthonomonadaceae bacterium]|nr:UbiA prenyltransferase family protein [Chthonomonadaceae bacterium]